MVMDLLKNWGERRVKAIYHPHSVVLLILAFLIILSSASVSAIVQLNDASLRFVLPLNGSSNEVVTNTSANTETGITYTNTINGGGAVFNSDTDNMLFTTLENNVDGAEFGNITISYWVNVSFGSVRQTAISKGSNPYSYHLLTPLNTGVNYQAVSTNTGTGLTQAEATENTSNNFKNTNFIVTWDSATDTVSYYENCQLKNSASKTGDYIQDTAGGLYIGTIDGTQNGLNGTIGEIYIWNRSLNAEEKAVLCSGNTTGSVTAFYPFLNVNPPSNITLISQTPSNITSQTLFSSNVNITYNYTGATYTNIFLNYTLVSIPSSCVQYQNGSCIWLNNTYKTIAPSILTNVSANISTATFTLEENDIYTRDTNLPSSSFSGLHTNLDQNSDNRFIKTEFLNISTTGTSYNLLEIMANTTSINRVYACNSTYTTGNVLTSPYCLEIGSINTTTYNHSHFGGNSSHQLIPFVITGGKVNGLLQATSQMYFLIRGSNLGSSQVWYVNQNSRTGATQTTTSNGVSWTSQTYSVDTHLHFYYNLETFYYYANGYNASATINSSLANEFIDVAGVSPTPPVISSPFETIQSSRYLSINWSYALPTNPTLKIQNYTLSLLNSDLSFNKSIVVLGNSSNSYLYDVYSSNLSIGSYYVRVSANDSIGGLASDEERFNLTTDALLNVSIVYFANSTKVNNFTLNYTNLNTSVTGSNVTTNGSVYLDVVKGQVYSFLVDSVGYALTPYNYSVNQSIFQNITIPVYTENSVLIFAYDETTLTIITENLTIVTTGAFEITNQTLNGTLFLSGLPDNTYTIKLSGANYTQKSYTISVNNRSTQTLNTFLSKSTSATIIQVYDENTGNDIQDVFVNVEKIILGNYTTIESKFTDITGRVQIVYTPLVSYRFTLSKAGYTTKQFVLNPVLFSSYSVALTPSTIQNNTYDYNLLSVTWYPKTIKNNQVNNLTFIITSPNGYLTGYNFSAYYKGDNKSISGVNAYGETLNLYLNVTNAVFSDKVIVNFSYTTTTTGRKYFSQILGITGANNTGSYTIANLKDRDYGLGSLEKALLVIVVVVILSGFSYYVAGIGGALTIGLLVEGVAVYLGFLPLPSVLISFLVGLALIVATSTGGNK